MQLRIVYSTFTHSVTYDSGDALVGTSDTEDLRFANHTTVWPLYTPASVLTSVGGSDAQLAAILTALGPEPTSMIYPYPDPFPGLIGTGLMPDGNQFIELDVTATIDRTFDEWQWYVDNDPGAPTLPAGFNPAWVTRRADVHDFKADPVNTEVRIQAGKHNLYSDQLNARLSTDGEGRLLYSYGLPSVTEAWIYDLGTNALLGTDANMSISVLANPESGVGPTEFEVYSFLLGGGAASQFWTNFHACVEDV